MDLVDLPPQPGEERWRFVEALQAPLWTRHGWTDAPHGTGHADLSGGVHLVAGFPDPTRRLDTAYEDLRRFLAAGAVTVGGDGYRIETVQEPGMVPEAHRLEVTPQVCRITAGDVEGIRRGICRIEDRMLAQRGASLATGTEERCPAVARRISRCYFGPIKRPPRMRDELADAVDYYPAEYLNRLAHEGVNGLWLTVEFRDLCRTTFTPDAGRDRDQRLAKLRRTADTCLRYGIRTFVFCIEPRAWDVDSPVPSAFPDLAGSPLHGGRRCFCPTGDAGQQYLYQSVNAIFRAVPELGGLINISHGERPTTCLSALSAVGDGRIDCPRCSAKAPWEILHATLSAMERGMHDAAPQAELISWLYMPQARGALREDVAEWVYDVPAHTPPGVVLQYNFESGVRRSEFGRVLVGGDYWLSEPGPSARFARVAETARRHGTPVSAKIQTGCSHELATVPFVPVPGLLYRKFAGMRRLGVTHAMLCWYFGNYPGLMNKAAGELSMEPFPQDEDAFLHRLASITWGSVRAPQVAEAWKWFGRGYERYPLTNLFQYYGPMHDGPVWPLLVRPEDAPLSPTWLLASTVTREPWPPSGDRIGECLLEAYSLDEAVELTRQMCEDWDHGVRILGDLQEAVAAEPEPLLDIGVARALGIQFRSGHNILRFYQARERLFRLKGPDRLPLLATLGEVVREELSLDEELLALCERDPRLGFHSEAEGYKYYPEKIRWRMRQLERARRDDLPAVEAAIRSGEPLFPEYTGARPQGAVARAVPCTEAVWAGPQTDAHLQWQDLEGTTEEEAGRWAAGYQGPWLYVVVAGNTAASGRAGRAARTPGSVLVRVEPRRLWPCRHFLFEPDGPWREEQRDEVAPQSAEGRLAVLPEGWRAVLKIPLERIGLGSTPQRPVRLNVRVASAGGRNRSWRPEHPWAPRLRLGSDNPADLGWLVFAGAAPGTGASI